MPIDTKNSYKYRNEVRVKVDSKTEEGKKLLDEYRRDQKYHYMDIGRVGRHLSNGKYYIEKPIIAELITIPKIIIRVREKAFDKSGKDVYELKTFLSRFGELDFYATVDYNRADLYFVEHVWVENLGIQENYSTLIYSIFYENKKVPMKEIFYKFRISANADDYGKRWKDIDITNTLIAKTKACLAVTCANAVAQQITKTALDKSLDVMDTTKGLGQKVVDTFNKTVKKDDDLRFRISKTPDLLKTDHLLNAIDTVAENKGLKNANFVNSINQVLDIQSDKVNLVTNDIYKATTPLCICNKFTELQESSIATIEGNITHQMADSEMINEGLKTSRTIIQTMPDGTKKIYLMIEPTDPIIENFDIKNETLITQIRIRNSNFDNVLTIDGQPVDISTERFYESSKKTRAYLVLQGMQADERFNVFSLEDEKEFKKKLRGLSRQEVDEIKRLRAQYQEMFMTVNSPNQDKEYILQNIDQQGLQGIFTLEDPTLVQGNGMRIVPELNPEGRLQAANQYKAQQEELKEEIEELKEQQETEEEREKRRLVESAKDMEGAQQQPNENMQQVVEDKIEAQVEMRENQQQAVMEGNQEQPVVDNAEEQAILARQQEQAEELQEEVIEAQTNGEDVKEHLANMEKQKAAALQAAPVEESAQTTVSNLNAINEKEKELSELAEKQEKVEQEKKESQARMQADLDLAKQTTSQAPAVEPVSSGKDFSGLKQDNINSGGSSVFEAEKSKSPVRQDSEGISVITEKPQKERSLEM